VVTLEILQGQHAGQRLQLSQPQITIGRDEGNTVPLSDHHLSSEHGQLFSEDDQVIYRDLRSTNGSLVRRGDRLLSVDAASRYEISLHDGDLLLLGDPQAPVVIAVSLPPTQETSTASVLAERPLASLEKVAAELGSDPAFASALLDAGRRLSRGVDLATTLDALCAAVFDLLPGSTHATVWMRSDTDEERLVVVTVRERGKAAQTPGHKTAGSRTVLRRVLSSRAAISVADAAQEMGASESIIGAQIRATLAAPLWHGEQIRGVIQVDSRGSAGLFASRDLDLLMVLAAQAALALENARLVQRLQAAEERLRGENGYLKGREEKRRFADIIGESAPMREVLKQLEKVLDTRATVCIEGETGTGKELIASAVHYQGRRRDKLFVAQNCAALPENLLESELFGHRKGAFTGADQDKKGLFELADSGTLFLDEIGEMSLSLQAKLLRVLQEGTIRPVGGTVEKQVDVRIVCATHRNLASEVGRGAFRQDLFYRLMVFPVRLPALRERLADLPALAGHFLRKYTQEYRRAIAGFSHAALDAMSGYQWPGNIRELENEVQRLVITAEDGAFIEPEHLSPQIRRTEGTVARIAPKKGTLKEMIEQVERYLIAESLREHGGNKTRTAETLGITREGLHKKLAKLS
jgi:Nif-specific regulatory protein